MQLAVFSDVLDFTPKRGYAVANLPAIHFQLRFAGTAGANTATQAGKVFTIARQPSQTVIQLGKLHLKLALPGAGSTRKDVQNQPGTVNDFRIQRLFQIPGLAGRQLIVDDHDIDAFDQNSLFEFFDFTFADKRRRIWALPVLNHFSDDARTSGNRQLAQFVEDAETDKDGTFH
jgi:hypothetical protein